MRDGLFDVTCLGFSADGASLASSDYQRTIRRWDWARGGAPAKHIGDPRSITRSFAFSPDGTSLATGDEAGVVRVWNVSTGKLAHTLKGPGCQVYALAFLPDGQTLLASAHDRVHHWDLNTGKEARVIRQELLGHSNTVNGLAISPAGRWVYSSSYDGSISIWEAASGGLARALHKRRPGYNGPVALAVSSDGTRLAAGFKSDWADRSVHVWDLTAGRKIAALAGHRAPVTALVFSPDGRRLVSGSADTTALVWDVTRLGPGGGPPDGKAPLGLWKDLGAADPREVYAAVGRGVVAGDAAVAQLKHGLRPAVAIDTAKVTAWARQLDASEFAQREEASQALADLGPSAEAALRQALEKASSPEARQRLERALEAQEREQRRQGHALEVLEMIGTPAARNLLRNLAKGASGYKLTRNACMALDRLEAR